MLFAPPGSRVWLPTFPSPPDVVDRMLEVAAVTKADVVYDLGCGDGRIPIAAAKKYGARGVGLDIDPKRIEESGRTRRPQASSTRWSSGSRTS